MAEENAAVEPRLPVSSLREALPFLRCPFTPEAIKFKVQSSWDSGGLIVAYIDARLVIERLNLVVGSFWSPSYREAPDPRFMWCDLTVFGVTRSDMGESPKKLSKDLVSDALKRAAVHFGIGVSVYALPQIRLKVGPFLEKKESRGKSTIALTEKGHDSLRDGYRKWLAEKNTFGEPFDHGDVEGQIDEPDDAEDFVPATPPALGDDKAGELVQQAKALYSELGDLNARGRLTPAIFEGQLAGVSWSHEELTRFVASLQERVEKARPKAAA